MLSVVCFPLYIAMAFTASPHASFLSEDGSVPTLPWVLLVGDPLDTVSIGAHGSALLTQYFADLPSDRSLVFSRPFDWTEFFESPAPTFEEFGSRQALPSQPWLYPPTEPGTNDRIEDAVRAGR